MTVFRPALVLFVIASVSPFGCAASPSAPAMHIEPASTSASSLVAFPEFPSLSPDGTTVVFSWAGDLWAAPTAGGTASRLTAHPATERKSAFSPDGATLAFESDRDGARNLYLMSVTRDGTAVLGGDIVRVTATDRTQSLSSFSSDGKSLFFSSLHEPELHRAARMYAVDLLSHPAMAGGGGLAGGPSRELVPAFGSTPRATPDGQILFFRGRFDPERPTYNGSGNMDLYSMSLSDKNFRRLTTEPTNDFDAWTGPDGSVVFVSGRSGQNNVWKLAAGAAEPGAKPVQLTNFEPTTEEYTIGHGLHDLAVSANGSTAVFTVWGGLYRLDLTQPGAKPERITIHVGTDTQSIDFQRMNIGAQVSEAALSPDGKTMAVVARGEVFIRPTTEGRPTRRVTSTYGRERDLAWSPDGGTLYFASDEEVQGAPPGAYAIYTAKVALAREDIKPAKPEEKAAAAEPKKDDAKPDGEKKEGEKKDDANKPDPGKRWAEAITFDVKPFIVLPDDARRPIPSPDGKHLLYFRGRGDIILRDLPESGSEAPATERVLVPSWDTGGEALWASDSKHVVYAINDLDFNTDIWLLDSSVADAKPINLTRHPDNDFSPRLSADGKVLTFLSERGSGDDAIDVYQVYLDLELEGMTAYDRDDYFKKAAEAVGKRKPLDIKAPKAATKDEPAADKKPEAAPAEPPAADGAKKPDDKPAAKADSKPAPEPKPLKFDADDAYLRIRRLTSSRGSESNLAVAPGGDRIFFVAPGEDGPPSLVSIDHKGQDRKVIAPGPLSNVDVSLTGDRVVFVKGGAANTSPKAGGKLDAWPIEAQIEVETARQQRQKFLEAARVVGQNFYHPTLKGLDWDKLTQRYLTLAEKTRTSESFNRVVEQLFGELNGSHLGISGGTAGSGWTGPTTTTGYLGVRVEPAAGGYRILDVTPKGPADRAGSRLAVGETIVEVDTTTFGADNATPTLDLAAAMDGTVGKETLLKVRGVDGSTRLVLIVPIGWGEWDRIRYEQIVQQRRDTVDKLSGGKLGYLHIRGMSEPSVRDFERDLYASGKDKDGLIIDVRDNGGGSTADILLSSLTAPKHAKTQPRGVDPKDIPDDAYPRDRRLIYAWTRPINVLINQNAFSNAEIFAHAIKTTKRGRLIGTATFGGVISTGGTTLIDGTAVRLPFRGWYLPDGTDEDNNGAKPDVDVPQTPQDEAAGRDVQLEAAVKDLLEQIKK